MNLEKINRVLAYYAVSPAASFYELAKTTSGNMSYIVSTASGEYVVRTLVRQSPDGAVQESRIQHILNQNGISTPLFMQTTSGDIVCESDDAHFVLSKRIAGSRQSNDTLKLAGSMGSVLALMHNLLAEVRISFNRQQWFNPLNVQYQLQRYSGPDKAFIERQTARYSAILTKNLPHALIHGDFHTNNIFSAHDTVTAVFDFESAEYTVRILDIARLYLTYIKVTRLDPTQVVNTIIEGYNKKADTPLQNSEHAELANAFIYVALVTSVSIYNHGNSASSEKYLNIAKLLITTN